MEGREEIDRERRRDMSCHGSDGFGGRGVGELYYSVGWGSIGRLRVGRWGQGHVGNKWLGTPVKGDEVAGEGGSGATRDNGSISEKEKGAASEKVRAHAYTELCFGFGIGGGVVGTS